MPTTTAVAASGEVELRTVTLDAPLNRTLVKDSTVYDEETVETPKGKLVVARVGDPRKTALLTFHDLGLNYISNFQVLSGVLLHTFVHLALEGPGVSKSPWSDYSALVGASH